MAATLVAAACSSDPLALDDDRPTTTRDSSPPGSSETHSTGMTTEVDSDEATSDPGDGATQESQESDSDSSDTDTSDQHWCGGHAIAPRGTGESAGTPCDGRGDCRVLERHEFRGGHAWIPLTTSVIDTGSLSTSFVHGTRTWLASRSPEGEWHCRDLGPELSRISWVATDTNSGWLLGEDDDGRARLHHFANDRLNVIETGDLEPLSTVGLHASTDGQPSVIHVASGPPQLHRLEGSDWTLVATGNAFASPALLDCAGDPVLAHWTELEDGLARVLRARDDLAVVLPTRDSGVHAGIVRLHCREDSGLARGAVVWDGPLTNPAFGVASRQAWLQSDLGENTSLRAITETILDRSDCEQSPSEADHCDVRNQRFEPMAIDSLDDTIRIVIWEQIESITFRSRCSDVDGVDDDCHWKEDSYEAQSRVHLRYANSDTTQDETIALEDHEILRFADSDASGTWHLLTVDREDESRLTYRRLGR